MAWINNNKYTKDTIIFLFLLNYNNNIIIVINNLINLKLVDIYKYNFFIYKIKFKIHL